MNEIKLPKCCFAADDDILKQKREELRKRLLDGETIPLKKGGEVGSKGDKDAILQIDKGKLADAVQDALAERRKKLRDALVNSETIPLKRGGEIGSENDKDAILKIEKGKLAALLQWYERDPMLLEAEKAAMNRDFPQFSLTKLSDGRLAWVGEVRLNVMGNNAWQLMAVYQSNHPVQQMGSSVYVYLVDPSIESLIDQLGWRPHHLLPDSNNHLYLCTTEASYVHATNTKVTSAASVMRWAIKWLLCFELVLTGDMTMEEFDKPHGI